MTRLLRTERRKVPPTHSGLLILVALILTAFVRIAAAAAPVFQGTFTSPGMCSPRGIAISPAGQVTVGSDCTSPHLARFTPEGVFLEAWAFPAGYQGSPNGVAADGSGNVFVTDYDLNRVHKFDSGGLALTFWGASAGPADLAVNGSGDVFVVALVGRRVEKFSNSGGFLGTIGSTGSGPGQYSEPVGLGTDPNGRLYVADAGRGRVLRFLANGSFDMEFAPPAPPYDVAVGPDGNVYVITSTDNLVLQYSPGGVLLRSFQSPAGMALEWRIAISSTGAIYITEQYNHRVTKFQIDMTTGVSHTSFGRLKALYR